MKSIKCCVPDCKSEGMTHHRFPNSKIYLNNFNRWLDILGIVELKTMDAQSVYQNKRICFAHFEPRFKSEGNSRLHKNAFPSIGMTGKQSDISLPAACSLQPLEILRTSPAMENPSVIIEETIDYPTTSLKRKLFSEPEPQMQSCSTPIKRRSNIEGDFSFEDNLLRSVNVTRTVKLSPKARNLYKAAVWFKSKARQNKKKLMTFQQRLKAAEDYTQTRSFQRISSHLTPTARMFFDFQSREVKKKSKGRRYSEEEKILALTLMKQSPKAYGLLHKSFILPSKRILTKLLSKIELRPGLNENLFKCLKLHVSKLKMKDRICTLLFDEMSIGPLLQYNAHEDFIEGLVDNGERQRRFADHALVMMARGVLKKWKQPVLFTFCESGTKSHELKPFFKETIAKLQSIGLSIIATVCDQAQPNVTALRALVNESKRMYAEKEEEMSGTFFEINGKKIVPLFDPPHLIKCIRNNILTKDLQFKKDNKTWVAKWQHVEQVYNYDKLETTNELRMLPKIRDAHVHPTNSQKMKVSLCTQVFSQRFAATMKFLVRQPQSPLKPEATGTAHLLLFMDQLFDSVNSSTFRVAEGKLLRGPLKEGSNHKLFWPEAIKVLNSMVYIDRANPNKTSKPPCLRNWISTIHGFELIWKQLKANNVEFLFLRNFNQDPLEFFFGLMRSHGLRNINPSCSSFVSGFKTLLVNNFMTSHSADANCEEDDTEGALSTLRELLVAEPSRTPSSITPNIRLPVINIRESGITLQTSNYCSGFVLKKLKPLLVGCNDCKADFTAVQVGIQHELIQAREYREAQQKLQYPGFSAVSCFIENDVT